ncbi:ferrous iron transport protein B [Saccharicrinis fermentans]|uniref:Ferrous iron transport protein B n=1 Tax=Saccharicrinis fermentans DSM 9555 = JCM 21142 TaxID=869213 RepID=W7Y9H1_9BACT|nr:ferrous iron transport protein B [Saccharicrinis fermentans]GAF04992.1 ferrous iron transport protein B [Saccharicrinis fermentans DSM 9555 = JCM 21142]
MNLSELHTNQEAIIVKVKGFGAFRKRITEMGFVKGKKVKVVKNAPLKDPIEYEIMDYKVSLRRSEAALVEVISKEEAKKLTSSPFTGTISDEVLRESAIDRTKTINIALVGNPNCGKTTLFNYVSGAKEHVGNYSGVTIDLKEGKFEHNGYSIHIVDLPGTYSLSAYSPEELFVRKHIIEETPDIIINVIDASNLERNLLLTTQLIDMDVKVVASLNMYDELKKKGDTFKHDELGKMLGIPFVPTVSSKRKGIDKLFDKAIEVYEDSSIKHRRVSIHYGTTLEKALHKLQEEVFPHYDLPKNISPRYIALKMLEQDKDFCSNLLNNGQYEELKNRNKGIIKRVENELGDDCETLITDAKYGFIAGALKQTYKEAPVTRIRKSEIVDTFITHKLFGFPIFFFFMWLMFQSTFSLGQYPMDWIEQGVGALMSMLDKAMTAGPFKDLLIDGIINGMGGVIVFLPNILILFFFISFMEDTGYMARAAFIMDKLMHKMGLHGKSFIPLIMGFGCNVPAIMATRTIEDKNNRLITMLVNPFMSCSARLPVYILFIGAFFPEHSGTILFGIYGLGILLAIIVAKLFRKFLFREKDVPFVMELPPYRMPTLRSTMRHMWNKGAQYLKKVGGIIMMASIIIWFLNNFPRNAEYTQNYDQKINELQQKIDHLPSHTELNPTQLRLQNEMRANMNNLQTMKQLEKQKASYIGRIGQFIEPSIRPLGFDWKMGVSILSGVAAKEVVVSTMAVIYHSGINDSEGEELGLIKNLQDATDDQGNPSFTPLVIFSFLIFILVYFPCIGVIATISRESGSWKWAVFTIFYTTGLAWLLSFIVYQGGSLLFY